VGWTDTSRGYYEIVLLGHTACCFDTFESALAPSLETHRTYISSSSSAITSIRLLGIRIKQKCLTGFNAQLDAQIEAELGEEAVWSARDSL